MYTDKNKTNKQKKGLKKEYTCNDNHNNNKRKRSEQSTTPSIKTN